MPTVSLLLFQDFKRWNKFFHSIILRKKSSGLHSDSELPRDCIRNHTAVTIKIEGCDSEGSFSRRKRFVISQGSSRPVDSCTKERGIFFLNPRITLGRVRLAPSLRNKPRQKWDN